MHVKTLILGAGVTGLSVGYHLEKAGQKDYLILEKEKEPGGLCRSIYKNGFTFDYSGHLLHLHTPYGKKLVRQLLPGNLLRKPRHAWIYTGQARVPFPFQANLYALPTVIRESCVNGLLSAKRTYKIPPKNFEQWCLRSFGQGIYQTFLRPYNTKLWGRPPRELTCEWCGSFIPVPSITQIRKSATQKSTQRWGYNASFYYPKQGGCGALVQALASRISRLKTNSTVTQIDLKNKMVCTGTQTISFDYLVNTLPLPVFLTLLSSQSHILSQKATLLSAQAVTVYHLALRGKPKSFSWIYCPDEKDPFYRVGLQSGFSSHNAPKGCYSLYIERPGKGRPGIKQERQIQQALLQKGIISEYDEKLFSFWQILPQAYVVYDKHRTPAVQVILRSLAKQNCFCAGRYGSWEYSFIERSLLQGRDIAKKIV